jgi:hypothetical protein
MTVLLFSLAARFALVEHGWDKEPKIRCELLNCREQKEFWIEYSNELKENSETAKEKIEILKQSRKDPKDKNYNKPWSWFETEIEQLKKIIKKSESHQIYSLKQTFPLVLALIILTLLSFLFVGRLIVLHAKSISLNGVDSWTPPHIFFGFLIAIFMSLAEVFTSVLATEKTWFGWDSFCVTQYAFVIKCITFFSYGLVAATPFTILWCLSRKINIPNPDSSAPDGKFGAGRYVEFLQTWTLWLILAPSALGIIWIRYVVEMESQFSPARLLHATGVGVLITLIVIRLIRNAIILRFRCNEAFQRIKHKPKDKLPADPTIAFIGTTWWKLPATVSAALASIWVLLEGLGIAKIILDLIR